MSLDLLNNAKAAIAALSIPSQTHKANEWLVDFEKSTSAWEVAGLLLAEPTGSPCRFFGAKFLHSKIQKQYIQLDQNAVANLTQSLVGHILNLSQEQTVELNVCRYLCLALAVLALQMNQSGIINQILSWLNPIIATAPSVLLELLQALPEEAYNRQVDVSGPTRDLFIRQLSSSATDVLAFLSTLWNSVTSTVKDKILLCTEKWIGITRISAITLQSQPIFGYILQSMSTEANFESSVDAVIAIIQVYQCREPTITQAILPMVLNLRANWSHVVNVLQTEASSAGDWCRDDLDEDHLNTARSLCRVFSELAESCVDLFVVTNYAESMNMGQNELLTQLLDCSRFPFDPSIARIPLKFFYELSMIIKSGKYNNYEEGTGSDNGMNVTNGFDNSSIMNHSVLKQKYITVFTYLLETALQHLQFTEAMLIGDSPLPEDTIDIRLEWKETVLDCCYVLGGEVCIEFLCSKLQQEVSNSGNNGGTLNWSRVETLLFCVQIMTSFLPREENKLIPQLINFVTALPEQFLRLHVTVVELLGRLAFWVESNPSYLPVVLSKLFGELLRPATSVVASKAVMSMFRHCNRLPGIPVSDLHNLIIQSRQSNPPTLSLESEIYLLESIAVVVARLPLVESEESFKSIMLPVASALNDQILSANNGGVNSVALIANITRLTVMFRFYHSDGLCVTQVFLELIPLFQRMLMINSSESVCEKLSSCYKHALRSCNMKFAPHLQVLTAHLSEQFGRTPYSAFLYAGSVCVSTFATAEKGAYVPVLYSMIWTMSTTFFTLFQSLEQFEHRPDVVEEYFFLMAKALQYCPAPFVEASQESHTVLKAAIVGLSLRHREAQKGILLFFERVVQLATQWPEGSQLSTLVRHTIKHFGAELVSALFSLLSGVLPAYAVDESNGCISDVLWNLKKRFECDFQLWLSQCLRGMSADAQNIATKNGLLESVLTSNSQKDFSRVLDRFEMTCRRCV